MSHNDFVEKLRDFFDPAQIENLEKFAEESAYDALIENIAGGLFLRSTYNDLLEQMRKEW